MITAHKAEVVAGFGGYASAPAYLAAWLTRTPLVIHEANAVPGFANRLGAKLTPFVATTFSRTRISGATPVGMPMDRRITHPETDIGVAAARKHFGLSGRKKTLLVTGGSQGSITINSTVTRAIDEILILGWQVLHIVGQWNPLPDNPPAGYHVLNYCDRMDLAFRAADAAISRAGAATVSEIQLIGLPAIFVPYPVGTGEQEKNAADSLTAGAAVMVADSDFTPEKVGQIVLPLLGDQSALDRMRLQAKGLGRPEAAADFVQLIKRALMSTKPQKALR
jgi:UDP-N-acetylglucosamine--N-acetylmuramyl-(pentapeptide) pyrophosphoryl-undecaprenol N-acetylglucosamine transferase